jgi:hypothetical protein
MDSDEVAWDIRCVTPPDPIAPPAVDADAAYGVAALFDGARRVAQSALCVLALDDVIDLGRDVDAMARRTGVELRRVLAAADAGIEPTVAIVGVPSFAMHPVERAALEIVGSSRRAVDEVMVELRGAHAMVELIMGCVTAGQVTRNGARSRRAWAQRREWMRRVPLTNDIEVVDHRRLLLAVHGPTLLFELAPDIPLALGLRRRPPDSQWMRMTGGG